MLLGDHPQILLYPDSYGFRLVACFDQLNAVWPHNLKSSKEEIYRWIISNDYKGRLKKLLDLENLGQYNDLRSLVASSIEKKLSEANRTRYGDKIPNMHHYLDDLLMLFPEAKIIHIVRDGRAVAFSAFQRGKKNLLLAAQAWVDGTIQGMVNQSKLGPGQYHMVRYEDLLSQPEQTLNELCLFLQLPYDQRMLQSNQAEDQRDETKYVKPSLDTKKNRCVCGTTLGKSIAPYRKNTGCIAGEVGLQITCCRTQSELSTFVIIKANRFRTISKSARPLSLEKNRNDPAAE